MTTAGIVDVVERARAHVCHGVHMGDIGDCKFCHLSCYIFAFAFTFGAAECYVLPSSSLAPCALALGLKRKKVGTQAKLQKRAFSAYEHKHWILMRAERAGALPGHARSALAGHRTRGAR